MVAELFEDTVLIRTIVLGLIGWGLWNAQRVSFISPHYPNCLLAKNEYKGLLSVHNTMGI